MKFTCCLFLIFVLLFISDFLHYYYYYYYYYLFIYLFIYLFFQTNSVLRIYLLCTFIISFCVLVCISIAEALQAQERFDYQRQIRDMELAQLEELLRGPALSVCTEQQYNPDNKFSISIAADADADADADAVDTTDSINQSANIDSDEWQNCELHHNHQQQQQPPQSPLNSVENNLSKDVNPEPEPEKFSFSTITQVLVALWCPLFLIGCLMLT